MHNEIYNFRKLKLEASFFRRQGATQSDSASGPEIISISSIRRLNCAKLTPSEIKAKIFHISQRKFLHSSNPFLVSKSAEIHMFH